MNSFQNLMAEMRNNVQAVSNRRKDVFHQLLKLSKPWLSQAVLRKPCYEQFLRNSDWNEALGVKTRTRRKYGLYHLQMLKKPCQEQFLGNPGRSETVVGEKHRQITGNDRRMYGFHHLRVSRKPCQEQFLGNPCWNEALAGETRRQLAGDDRRKDGFHHFQVFKKPCQNSSRKPWQE